MSILNESWDLCVCEFRVDVIDELPHFAYSSQFRATFANRFCRFSAGIDFFKGHRCSNSWTDGRTVHLGYCYSRGRKNIGGFKTDQRVNCRKKNVSICKRNEGAIFSLIQLRSIDHRASVIRNAQH